MPQQVIFSIVIECALIALTTILLAEPSLIFWGKSEKVYSAIKVGGLIFLCITFCWSVILGCLLILYPSPMLS